MVEVREVALELLQYSYRCKKQSGKLSVSTGEGVLEVRGERKCVK
jgi:hypothetical protein